MWRQGSSLLISAAANDGDGHLFPTLTSAVQKLGGVNTGRKRPKPGGHIHVQQTRPEAIILPLMVSGGRKRRRRGSIKKIKAAWRATEGSLHEDKQVYVTLGGFSHTMDV